MGTSAAQATPTGGNWSQGKGQLTDYAAGGGQASAAAAIASTVRALDGRGSGSGGGGGAGGGGSRWGGAVTPRARSAAAGAAGFLADAAQRGVSEAVRRFDVGGLEGRDGCEIVDAIAEAIVGGRVDLDEAIAVNALRDSLLDALGSDATEFDTRIGEYMNSRGIAGFIEDFLTRYVIERVWLYLGDSARERIGSEHDIGALITAFEMLCRAKVGNAVSRATEERPFVSVDWFGREGRMMLDHIADEMILAIVGAGE